MSISNKQKKILAFPYTKKYQTLICDGAVRSGKTSIMTVAFIDWAMREFNNTNFAICGKTVGSAIKNIVIPYMALSYSSKYNIAFTRSDNKMIVRYGSKTNTFYIYGGKDESSYMLIQGITLAGVFLDEVALMARSFVEQALARCISFKNRRYWFNCNPDNPKHWFYEEWIKQPEKHRALHLHFLMTDNPILDEETIREAGNTWSGVFYDRYVLGKWVAAEGAIYRIFSDNRVKYITPFDSSMRGYINIGVDFGGNKSATTFTAVWVAYDYSRIHFLESERHKQELTPDKLNGLYIDFVHKIAQTYKTPDACYADSAEQVLIRGMRAACQKVGVHTPIINSLKKPINDRIRAFLSLMGADRFFIQPQCTTLIEAFDLAVWDSKSLNDLRLDDGTTPIDDLDSAEYSVEPFLSALMYK